MSSATSTAVLAEVSGKIVCPRSELNLRLVLTGGQSFRWMDIDGKLTGVCRGVAWQLWQDDAYLYYTVLASRHVINAQSAIVAHSSKTLSQAEVEIMDAQDDNWSIYELTNDAVEALLRDYFQLEVNVGTLYQQWSAADAKRFAVIARNPALAGIRVLRQDPVECLLAFVCSSNNNIARISQMVESLCRKYGTPLGQDYFDFPNLEQLAVVPALEGALREMRFGYRAKYIAQTVQRLRSFGGGPWLEGLRLKDADTVREALTQLPGVGAKVADCVALMALDKPSVLPVDTHVWQITARDYLPKLVKAKSLTDSIYREIGNFYSTTFGSHAGWAQAVLFCSELKQFNQEGNTGEAIANSKRKRKLL